MRYALLAGTAALGLSLAAHGTGMVKGWTPQPLTLDGAPPQNARLGDSFADMVEGVPVPVNPTEVTEPLDPTDPTAPEPVEDMAEPVEPDPVPMVEPEAEDRPAEVTEMAAAAPSAPVESPEDPVDTTPQPVVTATETGAEAVLPAAEAPPPEEIQPVLAVPVVQPVALTPVAPTMTPGTEGLTAVAPQGSELATPVSRRPGARPADLEIPEDYKPPRAVTRTVTRPKPPKPTQRTTKPKPPPPPATVTTTRPTKPKPTVSVGNSTSSGTRGVATGTRSGTASTAGGAGNTPGSTTRASGAQISRWQRKVLSRVGGAVRRTAGGRGTATLSFRVTPAGRITSVRLIGSLGNARVDGQVVSRARSVSVPPPPPGATTILQIRVQGSG